MDAEDQLPEANRSAVLHGLVQATSGSTSVFVDLRTFGPEALGLSLAEVRAAHRWLLEEGLIEDASTGMQRVRLTGAGLARAADAVGHPDEPSPGMTSFNITNYRIDNVTNLQHGTVASVQHSTTSPSVQRDKNGFLFGVSVQAVGGVIAGVVLLFVAAWLTDWFGLGSDGSPSRDDPPAAGTGIGDPGDFVRCAETDCLPLRITNTIEAGRDQGVYVLSSPHGDGTRLSGVFSGTTIYAICRVTDGFEAIPGERRWVKASFDFMVGDVAPDGSFANPPGSRPSRTSKTYGWITADSVGPAESLRLLPECRE